MSRFGIALLLLSMPESAAAETGLRVSFENVLTGVAVGTQNVKAIQLEMEIATLGPVDLGWSIRKEGPGSVEGWGIGVHASRHWLEQGRVNLVTQAGIRFLAPGVQYNRFRYAQRDNIVIWQEWDRVSSNFRLFGADSGTWAPNLGVFAECAVGPVRIRGGVRATVHRYGIEVMHRPHGGDLRLSRNDRFFRVIFAPTIAIGF